MGENSSDREHGSPRISRRDMLLTGAGVAAISVAAPDLLGGTALAQASAGSGGSNRPNILVIWGDDIGWQNVSQYGMGTMGYHTPNIDRIGKEGATFTDHYAQPSCTAGRAAFITGQYPIRSGMTTVGQPGDLRGLQTASPSLAELMKAQGYATGHFGKSHLGDRNEHLPTNHGFDEFFGNLYHLNVSEEYEQRDYQNFAKNYPGGTEAFEKKYMARGVIHSLASDSDDKTVDPRFGKVGKQTVQDTGPLNRERMRTIDEQEVIPRAKKFMTDAQAAGKPFFLWLNPTKMHLYVRLSEEARHTADEFTYEGDVHGSGMIQHDAGIGDVLKFLDDSGLADNTIVWYSTDNGPEHSSWPDGATTPFRGEKMTTYEGGVRVISMLRWPGRVKAGTTFNGIQSHQDMFTSLAYAAGISDPAEWVRTRKKQYIDGVNNVPYWTGQTDKSARNTILHYFEGQITALRMGAWKWHFALKEDYYDNMTARNYPMVFNIRADPFESYSSIDSYGHLGQKVSWQMGPMNEIIQDHLKTLAQYPPVQGSKTFNMANLVQDFLAKGKD